MIAVEKANNNNAIATNLPPYWPKIPWENALAVSSAELTNDFPLKVDCSLTFPSLTFNTPVNKVPSDEMLISSAIDLEWIIVMLSELKTPLLISSAPVYSLTFESSDWTYFVNSSIWFG